MALTKQTRTGFFALLGPALVAGVAYLDPGNVATNLSAGTQYGYLLLWVLVAANLIAWLVQYLAAKLGLATNKSLSRIMGERLKSRFTRILYWLQAQLVAIATDLAELIGGAVALNLLFGWPLLAGCLATAVVSTALLYMKAAGRAKSFEYVIFGLIVLTGFGFISAITSWTPVFGDFLGGLVPTLSDEGSALLALGIFGATIMPHAVYVHSALSRDRLGAIATGLDNRRLVRIIRWDVSFAMLIAGTVNIGLLVLGAVIGTTEAGQDIITAVFTEILSVGGATFAVLFALALLASGLSSTSVGTYAGEVIFDGLLVKKSLPLLVRRLITLIPALFVLSLGMGATDVLVLSQVFLSFGIPFALFPLIRLTSDSKLMGELRNTTSVKVLGYTIASALSGLNLWILFQALS
jgi:manganese transport protein